MTGTDNDLVALVLAARDRDAFGELVRRHQALVRALLMRMCRNHALADDLAQDAFIRAYNRIDSFKGDGSFKAWLCRIAYTEFLMHARKRKSMARTTDALAREPEEVDEAPRTAGQSLDLDRALATLKDDERICVVLCFANGLTHSEAAEVTGLPLGTVKSHVNRGRDKLRAWFEHREMAA